MMTGRMTVATISFSFLLLFAAGAQIGIEVATNDTRAYEPAHENITAVDDDVKQDLEQNMSGAGQSAIQSTSGGLLMAVGPALAGGFEFGYQYPGLAGFVVIAPYFLLAWGAYRAYLKVKS